MLRHRYVRHVLGMILGACAGLSFTVSVMPTVLQLGRIGEQLELTRTLLPLWPWTALLWAAGGLSAVRLEAPLSAAILLGVLGAGSGTFLVAFGPGGSSGTYLLGLAAGLGYGGLGGLVLGRVLGPRVDEEDAS